MTDPLGALQHQPTLGIETPILSPNQGDSTCFCHWPADEGTPVDERTMSRGCALECRARLGGLVLCTFHGALCRPRGRPLICLPWIDSLPWVELAPPTVVWIRVCQAGPEQGQWTWVCR